MISPSRDFVRWVVWTQVRRGGRAVEGARIGSLQWVSNTRGVSDD